MTLKEHLFLLTQRAANSVDIDELSAIQQESQACEYDHMQLTDICALKIQRLMEPKDLPEPWKQFWKPRVVAGGKRS